MLTSAAILSNTGDVYIADFIPEHTRKDIQNQANLFLFTLKRENNADFELPYFETTMSRFIFRETGDLFWLVVTKPESDLDSDIDFLGKFVCKIMESIPSETTTASLSTEQIDLFYRHIWRPWDLDSRCPLCSQQPKSWQHAFEERLQFLTSIRDGQVDYQDVCYFNCLITEGWAISSKLIEPQSTESDDSIGEEVVVDGCRLLVLLEDIQIEISRLQDPYKRLFARRDILKTLR